MNITIKENAKKMLNEKLENDQFLRVNVVEGGCAGLTYSAEIDNTMNEDESVVLTDGVIRIVSSEQSRGYLNGLTVDYSTDLINGGLQFTNANTKSTCGCGQSFSLSGFPTLSQADGGDCCGGK